MCSSLWNRSSHASRSSLRYRTERPILMNGGAGVRFSLGPSIRA